MCIAGNVHGIARVLQFVPAALNISMLSAFAIMSGYSLDKRDARAPRIYYFRGTVSRS